MFYKGQYPQFVGDDSTAFLMCLKGYPDKEKDVFEFEYINRTKNPIYIWGYNNAYSILVKKGQRVKGYVKMLDKESFYQCECDLHLL